MSAYLSGQVNKVNHLNQTNQGGSSEQNKVKQVFREAILQKIPEFYEIFSQTGGVGLSDFIYLIQK